MPTRKFLNFSQPKPAASQLGQTLIETMVAAFILVMGITAAVGLAIYAVASATNVTKQIIATGLAREGIEAVKNMRDTNWLKLTLSTTCYNYVPPNNNNAKCYPQWLDIGGFWNNNGVDRGFRMDPGGAAGGQTYTINFDTNATNKAWNFVAQNTRFGLDFDSSGVGGFYEPSNLVEGHSDYYRTITLIKDSSAPYRANLEKLTVISQVWWKGKDCPRAVTFATSRPTCRIELRTFLTNWKNY